MSITWPLLAAPFPYMACNGHVIEYVIDVITCITCWSLLLLVPCHYKQQVMDIITCITWPITCFQDANGLSPIRSQDQRPAGRHSRRPQHHLRSCCCTRAYARVISWQNDRLGQYKQVPSLSGAIPSSPNSAPDLASCNRAHPTSFWNAIFLFAFQL